MKPAMFFVDKLETTEDGRFKVLEVSTITRRGRDVKVEIRVDLDPAMILTQGGVVWSLSGLTFRSLGKPSDGMLANFEQLSSRKGGKASRAKMKPEVHFARHALAGDPAKIGEEEVQLALRFEAAPQFVCRMVFDRDGQAFLMIDDESDEAAMAAFTA